MSRPSIRGFTRRPVAEAALLSRRFSSRGIPLTESDIRHILQEGAEAHWYDRTQGAVLAAPYRSRSERGGPLDGPAGVLALIAMGNLTVPQSDPLGRDVYFAHRLPTSRVLGERESEHALLHYVDALVRERDPATYFARWNAVDNGEFVSGQNLFLLLHPVVSAHVRELMAIASALQAWHGPTTAFVVPPLPLSRRVSQPVGRAASLYWGHLLEQAFAEQGKVVSPERLRMVIEATDLDFPMVVQQAATGGLVVPALTQTARTLVPEDDGEVALFEHGIVPRDPRPSSLSPISLPGLVWHDDGLDDEDEGELLSLRDAISLVDGSAPPPPTAPAAPRRSSPQMPAPPPTSLRDAPTVIREGPPSDTPLRHAERSRSPAPSRMRAPERPAEPRPSAPAPPRIGQGGRTPSQDPGSIEIPEDLATGRRRSPSLLTRLAFWRKK